ncbi:hypothetical protein BIY24_06865 [Halobacteriovorax marinus]|uniref:Exported protein n=1 Tax=Halobacteriovorax marinus (strain ATCC BAA-682 / DSM 15412 / SJ) TaxID=862908 RepID=E1X087_HALMS|nr:hypothetical protein [Halobacteriovorax marinus]ATH07675.1 hypothetical protein BIY24_06865 [Halobacteriovorax marinus]CBW26315.1 putative exported protein [Halobacteriovorax marinus SJ]
MKKFLSALCLLTIFSVMADTQVVYRYLNNELAGKFDNRMERIISKTIVNRCFGGEVELLDQKMDILMTDSMTSIIPVPENSKTSFDTRISIIFEFRNFDAVSEEEAFETVEVFIETSSNPNFKELMKVDISSSTGLCQ